MSLGFQNGFRFTSSASTLGALGAIRSSSERNAIRQVQERLNYITDAGLAEDGVLGPRTLQALQRWQRSINNPVITYGFPIDDITLASLGIFPDDEAASTDYFRALGEAERLRLLALSQANANEAQSVTLRTAAGAILTALATTPIDIIVQTANGAQETYRAIASEAQQAINALEAAGKRIIDLQPNPAGDFWAFIKDGIRNIGIAFGISYGLATGLVIVGGVLAVKYIAGDE